ncbi:hypothetical protein TRFO_35918 [Tritrichomonas foetus]|uniref:Uncharacterized protein n=1 Tax=Tritrichomonas foetus TaxID=1144522 RepID=A0A1J4JKK1_9EUKA|nr:hypothetical protein TRFO_35918 [Tritrichomonas foetus]|eukprot:OHS97780.1 hypothetical protein TRFO_35918 [Tritrichomonas foetus]
MKCDIKSSKVKSVSTNESQKGMNNSKTLYSEYTKLKNYIPPDLKSRLDVTDAKGEKISTDILKANRALAFFVAARENLVVNKMTITSDSLLHNLTEDVPEMLSEFSPLHVQATISLFNWVFANIANFAELFSKLSKIPNYFIFITIPSIFSNFSTKEAANFAFKFYHSVSLITPHDQFIKIVSPFFRSSCGINHFSKTVFSELFWSIYLTKISHIELAQKLIDISAKNITLLPDPQFSLLKLLSLKYKKDQIWKLLITVLILPQFWLQFSISPFSYSKAPVFDYKKVRDVLQSRSSKLTFPELDLISYDSSFFEIPDVFLKYHESYSIDLILSTADLFMIRTLFTKGLPSHMKKLNDAISLHINSIESFTQPFHLKIYPKVSHPPSFLSSLSMRPLLFTNSFANQFSALKNSNNNTIMKDNKIMRECLSPKKPDNDFMQLWTTIQTIAEERVEDPVELIMKETQPKVGIYIIDKRLKKIDIEKFRIFALSMSIDSMYETASLLEVLLMHQMSIRTLVRWNDLSQESVNIFSYFIANSIFQYHEKKKSQTLILTFYDILYEAPNISSVRFFLSLLLLSKCEHRILKHFEDQINEMKTRFQCLVEKKKKILLNETPDFESRVIAKCFWESNGLLSLVDENSSLIARYFTLLNFLKELITLSNAAGFCDKREHVDKLVKFAFTMGHDCSWILLTTMMLNATIFNDDRISIFVSEDRAEIWRTFSVTFFKVLEDDVQLVTQYGALATGDEIREQIPDPD